VGESRRAVEAGFQQRIHTFSAKSRVMRFCLAPWYQDGSPTVRCTLLRFVRGAPVDGNSDTVRLPIADDPDRDLKRGSRGVPPNRDALAKSRRVLLFHTPHTHHSPVSSHRLEWPRSADAR